MSCSSDEQSDKECPLCMEPLEIDDVDFYPCKCEYQICRFCWHRLKNDDNGLCPACRQPYPEDPVNFKPLSSADLQRIKDEKKMKAQAEKMRISESRKHLANYRVLQKNLVYVVGLSTKFASEDVLRKVEFFGKFGKILKIVLGTSPTTNLPSHLQPSYTAYITYNKVDEALRTIQGVNNTILDGRTIKASLGTTKYCSSFLRSQTCGKPECMYLHDTAESDISFTKEDMHAGKHSEYERKLIEMMVTTKRPAVDRKLATNSNSNHNGIDDESGNDETEYNSIINDGVMIEKEIKDIHRKPTPPSSTPSRHSPKNTEQDHDSSYSSLNADIEQQYMDGDQLNLKDVTFEAPPGLMTAPPGLKHSGSTNSLSDNTSKLLRLMNLSEMNGTGSVPAPAPQEEAPAPLMNWQTLLGLSPPASEPSKCNNIIKRGPSPSLGLNPLLDDDLGFDPFNESTKGLAALLEEERVDRHRVPHSTLPSYNHGHRSLSDLWGGSSLGSTQSRSQSAYANSPFDMFGLTSSNQIGSSYSQSFHNHPTSQYNDFHSQPHHYQQYQRQTSSFGPPPGLSAPRQQSQPQSIAEWQEGLKALLPNVNVRFSSDFEQQSAQRWSGVPMINQHPVPPPPGFSIPNR